MARQQSKSKNTALLLVVGLIIIPLTTLTVVYFIKKYPFGASKSGNSGNDAPNGTPLSLDTPFNFNLPDGIGGPTFVEEKKEIERILNKYGWNLPIDGQSSTIMGVYKEAFKGLVFNISDTVTLRQVQDWDAQNELTYNTY